VVGGHLLLPILMQMIYSYGDIERQSVKATYTRKKNLQYKCSFKLLVYPKKK
jgi:hypothetical protein